MWGRHRGPEGPEPEVIRLRLERPHDMFELPHSDLFTEYRNFLTGVDFCISKLRSQRSKAPVRLEIELPSEQAAPGTEERLHRTLVRYCQHRIDYNERERRGVVIDGLIALRVGVPIAALGFLVAVLLTKWLGTRGNTNILIDTAGWVLVWLGLWYPLDTIFFTPLTFSRENRVLERLGRADLVVRAVAPSADVAGPPVEATLLRVTAPSAHPPPSPPAAGPREVP